MEHFGILLIAALVVGASKGGLATAGTLAVPFLSIWIDPLVAAGLLLPIFIVSDVFGIWLYRHEYSRKNVILLSITGLAGVGLATLLVPYISVPLAQLATGAIGLFYCVQAVRKRVTKRLEPVPFDARHGAFWGVVTGITSFISHTGAPPFQAFVLPQRLPALAFAGTNVIVFAIINFSKLPAYVSVGLMADLEWKVFLLMAAVAAGGAVLGRCLVQVLPEEAYRIVIEVLLFALSLHLIVTASMHLV